MPKLSKESSHIFERSLIQMISVPHASERLAEKMLEVLCSAYDILFPLFFAAGVPSETLICIEEMSYQDDNDAIRESLKEKKTHFRNCIQLAFSAQNESAYSINELQIQLSNHYKRSHEKKVFEQLAQIHEQLLKMLARSTSETESSQELKKIIAEFIDSSASIERSAHQLLCHISKQKVKAEAQKAISKINSYSFEALKSLVQSSSPQEEIFIFFLELTIYLQHDNETVKEASLQKMIQIIQEVQEYLQDIEKKHPKTTGLLQICKDQKPGSISPKDYFLLHMKEIIGEWTDDLISKELDEAQKMPLNGAN